MPRGPYLTVLRLNPRHPDVAAETANTHRMHARVAALTGHRQADTGRILWAQPKRHILVIQSPGMPHLAGLPAGYALTRSTAEIRPGRWKTGQRVGFSLVANPVRRPPRPRDEHGRRPPDKRVPIPPGDRAAWLLEKLSGALNVTALDGQDLGTRTGRRNGAHIAHLWHAFTGRATVADPDALDRLVTGGVGPGKAYGAGLLIVRDAA